MKKALVPVSLFACALLAGALPAIADGGRIAFRGAIVEGPCPVSEGQLDCPPGRQGAAVIRALDVRPAQPGAEPALFAYALRRNPAQPWRLIEVTYR